MFGGTILDTCDVKPRASDCQRKAPDVSGAANDMTFEKKYLIEFSDILGVEIKCNECKGKVILEHQTTKDMFSSCPLCGKPWLEDLTDEFVNIRQFVKLLMTASDILRGRKFSMKLQVTAPPDGELHE